MNVSASRAARSMAGKRLRRPVHLVLDWDSTLTVNDTMRCVGQIPGFRDARLERRHGHGHGFGHGPATAATTWDEISRAYMNDYRAHKAACYPNSSSPAVSEREYRDWLDGLKPVEMRSVLRAQSSSFFRGVTTEDVKSAAKAALDDGSVEARKGWADLFELFLVDRASPEEPNAAAKISIISVNWSETFIRWLLWFAAQRIEHPRKTDICQLINDMEISANEIQGLNAPLGSSGRLFAKKMHLIQTSGDKARYMPPSSTHPSRRGSVEVAAAIPQARSRLPTVVYVGDSATDYECLKAAEIGIWLADVPRSEYVWKFREVFAPLESETVSPLQADSTGGGAILWAPDLSAISAYLANP